MVVAGIGTVIDLNDEAQCAAAISDLRHLKSLMYEAEQQITKAMAERSAVLGTKTFHLPDGRKAELRGGPETHYEAEEIEAGLRAAGMPEERIREVVKETVSYKVSAAEAKRAASANPVYAGVIEQHKRVVDKPPYVSISK